MKLRLLLALLTAFVLTACFQVDRVVRVKADGSGTIEETVTMSTAAIEQMKAMSALGAPGGGAGKAAPFELLNETKLKEEASKMGAGVTFVSAKKIADKDKQGFVATFAFTDINKLKLTTGPADIGPSDGPLTMNDKSKEEPVAFQFTKGKPATLTVQMPPMKKSDAAKADAPEADDPAAEAMMPMIKEMFKDLHVGVKIEVEGKIAATNAQFKDASSVTLMSVDFSKLLADPAKFKAMTKIKDPNSPEAKALIQSVPGMKIETANPLKITFQ